VARIKEVELAELKKIRKETLRRIRDFEKLYDLVKNQRNKFVNLIQVCPLCSAGLGWGVHVTNDLCGGPMQAHLDRKLGTGG